jgi:hypothetical protein
MNKDSFYLIRKSFLYHFYSSFIVKFKAIKIACNIEIFTVNVFNEKIQNKFIFDK